MPYYRRFDLGSYRHVHRGRIVFIRLSRRPHLYWRIAAPGELAAAISSGMEVEKVKAAFTTQRCHVCGSIEEFDAGRSVMHTCSKCGARWDQDENAARIMLAIARGEMRAAG